jgi:hypothetical protein
MQARIAFIPLLAVALAAGAASASFFDGKDNLICSLYQLYECNHPNACLPVSGSGAQRLSHLDINFKKKVITRAGGESAQKSKIKDVQTGIDGKLFIQGVEDGVEGERDGAGWTISIMDPEGTMVLAVAGDGFGLIGLGACVPKP